MSQHEIPDHLKAAARLGAAKQLGQVIVLVIRNGMRELYLADDLGRRACTERWMDTIDVARAKQRRPITFQGKEERRRGLAMDPWEAMHQEQQHRAPARRKKEYVFRVVEHLGSVPEGVRSTVLMEAEDLGVPIWNWPGERLPYRVEFPPEDGA